MIIELLLNTVSFILGIFLSLFPQLPQMDSSFVKYMDWMKDIVSQSVSFINFIFPLNYAIKLIGLILLVENFEIILKMVKWIFRKIPFINIKM